MKNNKNRLFITTLKCLYICCKAAINYGSSSIGLDRQSKLARRAKSFADMFEKHPEWLFTTTQQRFDLMYTGRVAFSLV